MTDFQTAGFTVLFCGAMIYVFDVVGAIITRIENAWLRLTKCK